MSPDAPTSTYRIQVAPDDDFDALTDFASHLADLGVGSAYLSPILTAAPGSRHGYDTIDHSTISAELGGRAGWRRVQKALQDKGIGVIQDIVPNHMAIPVPENLNPVFWDILRHGPASEYASWVDVTWRESKSITLPILGNPIDEVLDAGELVVEELDGSTVLRYYDHVLPVRPDSESLPLEAMLDRQHFRLAHWEVGREELDYRRFFDVDSLVGVKVEHDTVFDATHAVVLGLVRDGSINGLRVDHVDGLAHPGRYLRRLAHEAPDAWLVVEKILLGGEALPSDWPVAGTTGYDALHEIGGLFVDPDGEFLLRRAFADLADVSEDYPVVVDRAKREVLTGALAPELDRLAEVAHTVTAASVRLRDHTLRGLRAALVEILVAMPVYRAYVEPGEPVPGPSRRILEGAASAAAQRSPELTRDIEVLLRLALGEFPAGPLVEEFFIRFQQTCGPVMAKSVEDTAFYRWFPLASLGEVGGDPSTFGVSVASFHATAQERSVRLPESMITLTTHDTKRSEDVRARLAVLSEVPELWTANVTRWRGVSGPLLVPTPMGNVHDSRTEYLLWQSIFGAFPISSERLVAYATKAVREAGDRTSWEHPDEAYESAVTDWIVRVTGDASLMADVALSVRSVHGNYQANSLSAKLIALTMPGVPDVYQGTEDEYLTLVDPDNRAPRAAVALQAVVERALIGGVDPARDLGAAKARVVAAALRLRRVRPTWFGPGSTYAPIAGEGPAADHLVAYWRGLEDDGALVVTTRLSVGLAERGGWRNTGLAHDRIGASGGIDLVSGRAVPQGARSVSDVLADWPVALVVDRATAEQVWA